MIPLSFIIHKYASVIRPPLHPFVLLSLTQSSKFCGDKETNFFVFLKSWPSIAVAAAKLQHDPQDPFLQPKLYKWTSLVLFKLACLRIDDTAPSFLQSTVFDSNVVFAVDRVMKSNGNNNRDREALSLKRKEISSVRKFFNFLLILRLGFCKPVNCSTNSSVVKSENRLTAQVNLKFLFR